VTLRLAIVAFFILATAGCVSPKPVQKEGYLIVHAQTELAHPAGLIWISPRGDHDRINQHIKMMVPGVLVSPNMYRKLVELGHIRLIPDELPELPQLELEEEEMR